ncbi:MSCRAMM family protein [Candidatus Enterococcus murrayae]|uniref:LPXTG cell wall anchor domain-containing protein n=1 Tax=Candidatus Enterococcus murrayae TaxID=2815321 RepID=A0ABS3HEU6_9ENTE|nr:SpaA isopeptide-forming pilin-related protein [Enterococcus sp. MJM16]MBO0451763.1 LPXTG cell wall anchor domain-containing protein [Enterococcus sp. MJM16]
MKKNRVAVCMILFLMCTCMIAVVMVRPIVSSGAKDITDKISILGMELIKADGSKLSEENAIQVNDSIHVSYSLKIAQEEMDEISSGDTFIITLPDARYFQAEEQRSPIQLKEPETEEVIGQVSLMGDHFRVTINENGADQIELKNFKLAIKMRAIKAGEGISAGGNGAANIPKLKITELNPKAAERIQAETQIAGVGSLTDSRNFEYVIVDKANLKQPIAYGITERKIVQKGERVKIVFYKGKTIQGSYLEKIEGNIGVTGWYSILKDNHSYLLREIPNPEYLTVITGGIGEGGQYDYQIENHQTVRFTIFNQTALKEQLPDDLAKVPRRAIPQIKNEDKQIVIGDADANQRADQTAPKKTATFSSAEKTAERSNEEGINLTKIDSVTGEKLQGAEFELNNEQGEKMYLRRKLITDESGLLHINPLPIGKYSLIERSAPEGYELDSEPINFTFSKKKKVITLTKENTKKGNTSTVSQTSSEEIKTTKESSNEQTSKTTSSSIKKQYPKTGTIESGLLSVLGYSLLGVMLLYRKRR